MTCQFVLRVQIVVSTMRIFSAFSLQLREKSKKRNCNLIRTDSSDWRKFVVLEVVGSILPHLIILGRHDTIYLEQVKEVQQYISRISWGEKKSLAFESCVDNSDVAETLQPQFQVTFLFEELVLVGCCSPGILGQNTLPGQHRDMLFDFCV